ncbi:hypothetical protein K466DRAFT_95801 [Polyporus arcularius HHB13444]|uniref:Lytic polysaccharide monooxygenase n=1 Tax=Polyporus arcularius HHB13444 TaxID=1314778 RepID=A0A5C3PF78_9APHY|nr:hypothetical protein K466DRAFT_95801 [Polyporus arcularius HHB13444]
MVLVASLTFAAFAFGLCSHGASVTEKAHLVTRASEFTPEPVNGTTLVPGSTFPFSYQPSDSCHGCFSPISVYLSTSPPTAVDITSSGELANGTFVAFLGDFDIPNCGFPLPGGNPPPPPSELLTPTLAIADGTTLYFSVVETFLQCPPIGQTEFGLYTITVTYA